MKNLIKEQALLILGHHFKEMILVQEDLCMAKHLLEVGVINLEIILDKKDLL